MNSSASGGGSSGDAGHTAGDGGGSKSGPGDTPLGGHGGTISLDGASGAGDGSESGVGAMGSSAGVGDAGAGANGNGGTGASGNGGTGASGNGGAGVSSGAASGAAGGDAGGAIGDGGSGGAGSGPLPEPGPPGILGAVRLMVDGAPHCGGTLMSNAWVLTADRCVSASTPLESLRIGFGADSTRFEQTRNVVEVVRFPGNDGTAEQRGRDLLLLGVDDPFVIAGSASRHYLPLTPQVPSGALSTQNCVGWDMDPDPESDTSRLRSLDMTAVSLQTHVTIGTRAAGDRLWWLNIDGILPTENDVGTGCFQTNGQTFLTTVQSEMPAFMRNGLPNDGREAYSQILSDPPIREWLESSLLGLGEQSLEFVGEAGGCSLAPGTFELFALRADGAVGSWHWDDAFVAETSISGPPGVALSRHRPGVLCTRAGAIELLAVDEQGGAWRRSRGPEGTWSPNWESIDDVRTKIASGLAVTSVIDGHFHVFAVDESGELRHAEFDKIWTGRWDGLDGGLTGTPVARMGQKSRIDVFVSGTDHVIWQRWELNDEWQGWVSFGGPYTSGPALTSWAADRVDLWARSARGTLLRKVYDSTWAEMVDTGMALPEGDLLAITPERGQVDVLVASAQGNVTHAHWPRLPAHGD